MAVETMTVRKSDVSGDVIPNGTGARIRVMFADGGKEDMRADLTDDEVAQLLPWAKPVQPRPDRRKRT